MNMPIKYKLGEGEVIYVPKWADDPEMLYREAQKLSFTPETVTMYGKINTIERRTVDYGLPYSYNKTAKPSIGWEGIAIEVRKRLESQLGITLLQCACNQYASPTAYIGAHRDKPTVIGGESVEPKYIVSLSLGSARKMVFIPKEVGMKQPTVESMSTLRDALVLELLPGSLVLFSNAVNQNWKHAIPQDKSATGARISLTYREF
ncbi:MAG TPA: alpha-ketoglutarate-dependent dioxygenase AlkB [Candidatus Acidoferrales bacterium]